MAEEKGAVSVREAGRRGGVKTAERHGSEHYAAIGRKGGAKLRAMVEAGKQAMEAERETGRAGE